MRAPLSHRLVGVSGGEDARRPAERRRMRLAVVAGAVEPLVMGTRQLADRRKRWRVGERALGEVWVQLHTLPVGETEGSGLLPDCVRNRDSAEVERERGAPYHCHVVLRKTEAPSSRLGELGRALGVSAQPIGLEVGERPDHAERGVDLIAGHPPLWRRLGRDRLVPDQRVVEPVEQLVKVVSREGGQVRVVGAARALLDHGARPLGARGGQEDRDVARDMEHPCGRRDRLPCGRAREPVPVPALEDVRQVRDNAGAEAEPPGEALRDLAMQRERRACDLESVLERVGDHSLTYLRRSSLSHHVYEKRAELVEVASVHECELGARLDVVPEELSLLGRVRCATDGVQQ